MPDQRIRVLLIEDNPTDVLLIREALAEVDSVQFALTVAERLAKGLERLREQPFDVVLLDLGLPDSQGLETFLKIRGERPGLPVVVLTGLADDKFALKAVQEGAQDYLVKGRIGDGVLARAIRYAIERKRAEVDLAAKNEELRAMTQQLWQTAKLATMGELAANIAHELNNPLATISLRVESLLAQTPAQDDRRRALEIIQQEVERMGALVASLLQFSRRNTQQISTLDLREEIDRTLELIYYLLRTRGIAVAREYAPDLPPVQADRQQLRQMFLNLITNAADAMPKGGTLTIRVSAALDRMQVVMEISDTGVGIAAENLSQVMEPFYTTKPEGKGTGLGLAICRRIAQEHNGTLDLTSAGPGQGTTVRIALPVNNGSSGTALRRD